MDSISFWLNPVLIVGISSLLGRFLTRKFDSIDRQFDRIDTRFERIDAMFDRFDSRLSDLTREVVANGKSLARIEGHPRAVSAAE